VTNTLTKAGLAILDSERMKDKFGTFILKVASNENVKSTLYQHYLVKPAKRIFSFGLINGDDDNKSTDNNKKGVAANSKSSPT
jgi:hypothetical protein